MIDDDFIKDYAYLARKLRDDTEALAALNRIRSRFTNEKCSECVKLRNDRRRKLKTIKKLRQEIKDFKGHFSPESEIEAEMIETGWNENDFSRRLNHGSFSRLRY